MTYVPAYQELGDVAASGYRMVDDIAVPLDAGTLLNFQTLQRDINAIMARKNEPLIDVDGRIGSKTVAALLTISDDPGSITGAQVVADDIWSLLTAMTTQMAALQAYFVPDPVPSSPPSVASGTGVVNPPDDIIRSADGPSMTTMIVIAVGVGVAAAYLFKKKRRK